MQYLVGYELRNQAVWALPLSQCAFDLGVEKHQKEAKGCLQREIQNTKEAQEMLDAGFSVSAAPNLDVPEEIKQHLQRFIRAQAEEQTKNAGNRVDRWIDFSQINLAAYWNGDYYFFRTYTIVEGLQQALAWQEA